MRIQHLKQHAGWKLAPFLRLIFPLIAGILLQYNVPAGAGFLVVAFFLSFLSFIFCHAIPSSKFFGREWIPGFAIQFVFIAFGRLLMFVHQDIQVENSPGFLKNQANCMAIQILSDPIPKQKSYKCLAQIRWLINNQTCFHANEKILVYFSKNPGNSFFSGGSSLIIIQKPLQPIENLRYSDFDYKRYCRLKHIYAQVFLRDHEFQLIRQENKKTIFSPLDSLRKKILSIIKNQVPGKSENSLLEALLVGFTDDMDPGLLKSYADTGVIHIIAISGLHLALICHILQLVLKSTGRKKSGRRIKLIVIITCLWIYALLSGASPSVIRAAMMFSLVLFARNILRETSLFNTLAASAFLLLCFDPYWILDTGFQLSYAAVLGLGLFSKPLQELIPLQNKILNTVWNAASVSIAAQILTTPISIFYFHRFPVYFLIANLLAVPLSSLILAGGILLCIFAFANPLASPLAWLLGLLIQFLNGFINHVSGLPGSVIGPLNLSIPRLILVYFIIFCLYRFTKWKEKKWLFISLTSICIFQLINLSRQTLP